MHVFTILAFILPLELSAVRTAGWPAEDLDTRDAELLELTSRENISGLEAIEGAFCTYDRDVAVKLAGNHRRRGGTCAEAADECSKVKSSRRRDDGALLFKYCPGTCAQKVGRDVKDEEGNKLCDGSTDCGCSPDSNSSDLRYFESTGPDTPDAPLDPAPTPRHPSGWGQRMTQRLGGMFGSKRRTKPGTKKNTKKGTKKDRKPGIQKDTKPGTKKDTKSSTKKYTKPKPSNEPGPDATTSSDSGSGSAPTPASAHLLPAPAPTPAPTMAATTPAPTPAPGVESLMKQLAESKRSGGSSPDISFPNARTGTCARGLTLCDVTVSGEGLQDVGFGACTKGECAALEIFGSDVGAWTTGLWTKFVAVSKTWTLSVEETQRDFQLVTSALGSGSPVSTLDIAEWVNSNLTVNKCLLRRGYSTSPLLQRMAWDVYKPKPWSGKSLLIVGAGPIGLRMAIEGRLMGAQVSILESRSTFTRANVMKMWRVAKSDLFSIGLGEFAILTGIESPKCNIALMQHALLRVALLIGVDFVPNTKFKHFSAVDGGRWTAVAAMTSGERNFDFDAIIDASGTRSVVSTSPVCGSPLFSKRTGNAGTKAQTVAVTSNFHRFKGDTKKKWAYGHSEWTAVGAHMWQDVAEVKKHLGRDPAVDVSDLVWFQSLLSNYLVIATDVDELVKKDVFKDSSISDVKRLVKGANVNWDKLEGVVHNISDDWKVPYDESAGMLQGINKMSIFDFTHLDSSLSPETKELSMLQVMPASACADKEKPQASAQLMLVIGDCLTAPFWPEGTGMSRGILSVAHGSFALQGYWTAQTEETRSEAMRRADGWAKLGVRAMGTDCKGGKCKEKKWKQYMEYGYAGKVPPTHFTDMM